MKWIITHYQFVLASVVLTDHGYDADKDRYLPVNPELLALRGVAYSELLDPEADVTAEIPLVADLGQGSALPDTVIVVTVAGVLFFQQLADGEMYPLKSEQALRVLLVV